MSDVRAFETPKEAVEFYLHNGGLAALDADIVKVSANEAGFGDKVLTILRKARKYLEIVLQFLPAVILIAEGDGEPQTE